MNQPPQFPTSGSIVDGKVQGIPAVGMPGGAKPLKLKHTADSTGLRCSRCRSEFGSRFPAFADVIEDDEVGFEEMVVASLDSEASNTQECERKS